MVSLYHNKWTERVGKKNEKPLMAAVSGMLSSITINE